MGIAFVAVSIYNRYAVRGGYRQVVKTMGCGSIMRGFESHYPPQFLMTMGYRQAVRQWILIPSCAGSNPATLAKTGKA